MSTHDENAPRAGFAAMEEGTAEDWGVIASQFGPFAKKLPERVLDPLRLLDGDFAGFPIDRLQHSLQTATRAHRDARDEEYVVMALLHDIGDTLGSYNHPDIAAAILKPFISEENHWIVANHGIFQGYYFWHHIGMDRDAREAYRDHEWFDDCAEFCEVSDQAAFEPHGETPPLEESEAAVRRVFVPRSGIIAS